MSSVFALNASPSSAMVAPAGTRPMILPRTAIELRRVGLQGRAQHARVDTALFGNSRESRDVLREARAAEAQTGMEERRADAAIAAGAVDDVVDVGADLLANVRDLVDERYLGRQERVGRVT